MTAATLFRATLFHTPRDPFRSDDGTALVCVEDGGLLVRAGRVEAVGDYPVIARQHPGAGVEDRRGSFIVPGFVDAHVHFPQVRIIGAMGLTLLDWLEQIALPEEARMADARYAASTAELFVRALLASGTTAALAFGAHFPGATAALFDAAERTGLRLASGLVVSDRRLRPELHLSPAEAHEASRQLIARYHGRGRLRYAVTPRFALSTTEPMLEVCQELLRNHPGVLLQTHLNENRAEIADVALMFPWAADYLSVYDRYGLTGTRSVFAHNVHATEDEIGRLAAAGASVAHCPCSNAVLGSGTFPLKRHLQAGVRCALGTDVGGGTGFGVMKEALQAYLVQRLSPDPQPLDPARLLYLATRAGAEAIGLGGEIGDFQPGKSADFVCLTPKPGSPLDAAVGRSNSARDALGALITMAGADAVSEVRIAGQVVFDADA